jgi:topoisomerase-4 subunit A
MALPTTDYMLLFTSKGNYLYIPVDEIKETKWNDEGFPRQPARLIAPDEKLVRGFAVSHFRDDLYLSSYRRKASSNASPFRASRSSGGAKPIRRSSSSMTMSLVGACLTSGNSNLFIASNRWQGRFL